MKHKRILSLLLVFAMALSMLTMGASATNGSPDYSTGNVTVQFGDPDYAATQPESLMTLTANGGNAYTANYTGNNSDDYYPDVLSLYAIAGESIVSTETDAPVTRLEGSGVQFSTFDEDGNPSLTSSLNAADNINNGEASNLYSLQIGATGGDVNIYLDATLSMTIHFSAPKNNTADGGIAPTYINGYLPIGQYCNGLNPWAAAWGNIFSDTEQTTTRLTSGYAAQGVSLGAAGGYVQMEFATPIGNDADNPYGIDFVVYGNAFKNNPEAASVKVSNDGVTWYELAGSLYYAEDTMHNATVSYTVGSDDKIDYALNDGATMDFGGTVNWFPTTDFYSAMTGITTAVAGNDLVTEASLTASELTYNNVTLVKDTDTTDDYLFGYADIRPVGNSIDGTACNPYASTPSSQSSSAAGGDGFDLAWAVDEDGTPVNLAQAKYVRIYSSAALDTTGAAFTVPSIFGETSAEVCGVYVAQGEDSSVGTTAAPTITLNSLNVADYGDMGTGSSHVFETYDVYEGATLNVQAPTGSNVFINGVATSEFTATAQTTMIQVIVQNGDAAPYIAYIK